MLGVFSAPGHYVQGRDATAHLGEQLTRLGLDGPVLVVASPSALRLLAEAWKDTFTSAGIGYTVHRFGGECSRAEIDQITAAARQAGAAVVLGAGGGKALDAARAAADDLRLPMVSCPTTASSDAPCSALSVVYTDTGQFASYQLVRRNPALVLIDTTVIAQAPARTLVAGMGDALATWVNANGSRLSTVDPSGIDGASCAAGVADLSPLRLASSSAVMAAPGSLRAGWSGSTAWNKAVWLAGLCSASHSG